MHWLKRRLKMLGLTQSQLSQRLEAGGIYRSRQAISSWVQPDNDVPMLANPQEALMLANALDWSLTEMLIAAGYEINSPDVEIPPQLIPLIIQFAKLDEPRLEVVMETLAYSMRIVQDLDDDAVAEAEGVEDD